MNRRAKISKNVNPYKNNHHSRDNKSLRHSANRSPFFTKKHKFEQDINNDEISINMNDITHQSSSRISEDLNTQRDQQILADYSKVIRKLQKVSVSRDRAIRNQVNQLEAEHKFVMNNGERGYSRKSQ